MPAHGMPKEARQVTEAREDPCFSQTDATTGVVQESCASARKLRSRHALAVSRDLAPALDSWPIPPLNGLLT